MPMRMADEFRSTVAGMAPAIIPFQFNNGLMSETCSDDGQSECLVAQKPRNKAFRGSPVQTPATV